MPIFETEALPAVKWQFSQLIIFKVVEMHSESPESRAESSESYLGNLFNIEDGCVTGVNDVSGVKLIYF